jgi:Zn-dependent protease
MMEESEQPAALPPKPSLEKESKPTNWGRTVFTMLLFFAIYLWMGFDPMLLILIVAVLFTHEAGHFVAMKAFGYRNVNMFFLPLMGASVSGDKPNVPYRHELMMILAGPVPGIFVGMVMLLPFVNGGNPLIEFIATLLIGLNLLNMLPIFPLDGGRVMDKLFAGSNHYLRIVFLSFSLALILAYIVFTQRIIVGLLAFGIMGQLVASFKYLQTRRAFSNLGLNFRTSYDELSNEDYWRLHHAVRYRFPHLQTDQQIAEKVAGLLLYSSARRLGILEKLLFFFVWLFFLLAPVAEILWVFSTHDMSAPSDVLPKLY